MNEEFSEILRDYVLEEQQKNPSANGISISKKMNIPPTTFNRLLNGHSKPSANTLSKLLQYIPELKKSLPEEISRILKVTLERENKEYIEEALETVLSDKYAFLCWVPAFSKRGITEREIRDNFGRQGLTALKTLAEKNILSKDEDTAYKVTKKDKDTILSFRLIKTHFMFLSEQYRPDNVRDNYIHYWVQFVNEKGLKKLMRAHQEFHRTIGKIMDDRDNQGDMPAFSIACSDLLSQGDPKEGER